MTIYNILSVPFCPYHFVLTILSDTILSVYHFVHTILSIPFCPYHFVLTILSDTILSVYHFAHTILSVPFCPLPFCPRTQFRSLTSMGRKLHFSTYRGLEI